MANTKRTNKKNTEGKETVEFFKDLDREALHTERFLEKNSKLISLVFGVLVLGVLGYFAYQQFVIVPKNEEATKSYLSAMGNLAEGKTTEALGGKSAANPGFLGTYENYGNTDAGSLAGYHAGLLKFKEGKFQEAYNLLDQFSSDNKVLMALKYGAMADAASNLNKADESLSLLTKAANASDDPYTTYYFTRKKGILALALNKTQDAKTAFETIDQKYKEYDNGLSDSYIEMVKNK